MTELHIGAQMSNIKAYLYKILIAFGIILTFGALGFIVYKEKQNSDQQTAIQKQVVSQQELANQIIRSQSQYTTKDDLNTFIKNSGLDLKTIQDDLNKLSANITSANQVIIKSNGSTADHVVSSSTTDNPNPILPTCKDGSICPNADPYGYLSKQQNLQLIEPFGQTQVPIGEVGFSAWQNAPWNMKLSPRQYQLTTVVGLDENQRQYFYNKFIITVDGKQYTVNIDSSQTEQQYPTAKFSFWNPRLYIGIDGGLNLSAMKGEFGPSINLQLMSYGIFKSQPDWSILQLGVGYGTVAKQAEFILTPFTYNIGKNLPLMNNLYLGPALMINSKGDISVMAAVRVGL